MGAIEAGDKAGAGIFERRDDFCQVVLRDTDVGVTDDECVVLSGSFEVDQGSDFAVGSVGDGLDDPDSALREFLLKAADVRERGVVVAADAEEDFVFARVFDLRL